MDYQFINTITNIDSLVWNSVVNNSYPFMRYEFLLALETSGCVGQRTGWNPHHLIVWKDKVVVAVMPLYLKYHSYGEYVFDFAWARAYEHYGISYYPKLLSAIPFVPATGARLVCSAGVDQKSIFTFASTVLTNVAIEKNYSSIHVLLPDELESNVWNSHGLTQKITTQFHWSNNNYDTFNDFLNAFNSRKRKAVRKEREAITQKGIVIERLVGSDIVPGHWDTFYEFYCDTYQKKSGHNGYLNREFFAQLTPTMLNQTLIIFAQQDGKYIAGALYFFSDTTLYGRHWGGIENVEMLHFELCYYSGIQFCIERGLQRFEAGAQGEHKIQRGFAPTPVYSNHWILDEKFRAAISENIREETNANITYREEMKEFLPYKQEQ